MGGKMVRFSLNAKSNLCLLKFITVVNVKSVV